MSTTPNMQLVVPEVLVTTGPQYATQVNTALDVIDSHDHSAGKGVRITPSGLNINGDLSFGNNQAVNLKALVLASQTSVATVGAAYNKNGDLFWRNGAGNEVQLTTGGSVNVSGVGGITGLSGTSASASYTNLSKVFSWLSDASTYAKTDTGDLTIYSRSGAVGAISGVTLVADVATSAYSLRLPASGPADNQIMRMKAATAGAFVDLLGTNNQVTVTHNTSNITLALPQNIHTAATPTFAGLTLTGNLGGTTLTLSGSATVASLISTGAVSGTSGTFSGNISLTGAAGATVSASNYDATFATIAGKHVGQTSSPASWQIGYTTRYFPGANIFLTSATSYEDNILTATIPAGIWEVDAQLILNFQGSGNVLTELQWAIVGVSSNISAYDDDSYNGSQTFTQTGFVTTSSPYFFFGLVRSAPRTIVLTSSTPYYVRVRLYKTSINTNTFISGSSYLRIKRIG